MSDLFWLADDRVERLRPFLPKSHGKPQVNDRWVLSRPGAEHRSLPHVAVRKHVEEHSTPIA